MRPLFATLSLLGLLALAAGPVSAGPAASQKGTPAKARHHHAHDPFALPAQVHLTADQQTKLDALKKQYGPRLAEVDARIASVLTPERRKAAAQARHTAAAEGKKGKELHQAVQAALNLPAADQAQLQDAFKARRELVKEIHQQKMALLTDAQKAQLKHHHKAAA